MRREIKKFDDAEWEKLDSKHYGREVDWKEKKFVFKAILGKKLVGVIKGKVEAGVIYVATIIVSQKEQGKGIGTALIERAIDFGKKEKAHKIWLFTGKDWAENEFYRKLGFAKIADLPKHYLEHDFVIYSKFI